MTDDRRLTTIADTIIIGAGAAGLAAALELHDAGHDAIVLEARDRVGGRTWTDYELAPHAVELGAEFIHGENVATWRYLERFGFTTNDQMTVLNVRGFARRHGSSSTIRSCVRPPCGWRWKRHAAAHEARDDETATLLDAARAWADANGHHSDAGRMARLVELCRVESRRG